MTVFINGVRGSVLRSQQAPEPGNTSLWEEARSSGSVLLTKDDDFLAMSMSLGWPPKVICLAIGNASNAATAQLILSRVSEIGYFHEHPEAGFLLLKPAS